MGVLGAIALAIIALVLIGYGLLANFAQGMSDAPTEGVDKGGCGAFIVGVALIGLIIWSAV